MQLHMHSRIMPTQDFLDSQMNFIIVFRENKIAVNMTLESVSSLRSKKERKLRSDNFCWDQTPIWKVRKTNKMET